MKDQIPFFRYGQGRDDERIEHEGMALAAYLVIAFFIVIAATVYVIFR